MTDFFLKRLAPLLERSHSAWEYQGEYDATRLQRGGDSFVTDVEAELLTSKFMGPGKPGGILGRIPSLWQREDSGKILLRMPSCDEHGARGHVYHSVSDLPESRRSMKDPSRVTPRSYVPDPSGSSGAAECSSSQTPVVISDASEDEEDRRPLSSLWPRFFRRCRVEPRGSASHSQDLPSDPGGPPRYSRVNLLLMRT